MTVRHSTQNSTTWSQASDASVAQARTLRSLDLPASVRLVFWDADEIEERAVAVGESRDL